MIGADLGAAVAAPERFLLDLVWCSLRAGAALALLPAMAGALVPVQVRIGIAGTIGAFVMTGPSAPPPPADLLSLAGAAAVAGELLVGLVLALALHAAFAVAAIAGEWIAQAMGLGFATLVSPVGGPASMLGILLGLLMWAIFLNAGGHLLLFQVIIESYRSLPSPGLLLEGPRLAAILSWGGFALASGLIAALPLGGTLLLLNIILGVAARSAPQLNLFAIGFPLMLLTGLAGLPLALPGIAGSFATALVRLQEEMAGVLLGG